MAEKKGVYVHLLEQAGGRKEIVLEPHPDAAFGAGAVYEESRGEFLIAHAPKQAVLLGLGEGRYVLNAPLRLDGAPTDGATYDLILQVRADVSQPDADDGPDGELVDELIRVVHNLPDTGDVCTPLDSNEAMGLRAEIVARMAAAPGAREVFLAGLNAMDCHRNKGWPSMFAEEYEELFAQSPFAQAAPDSRVAELEEELARARADAGQWKTACQQARHDPETDEASQIIRDAAAALESNALPSGVNGMWDHFEKMVARGRAELRKLHENAAADTAAFLAAAAESEDRPKQTRARVSPMEALRDARHAAMNVLGILSLPHFAMTPGLEQAARALNEAIHHATTEDNAPGYVRAADFVAGGYLLELNRRFLHPLGMALEVFTGRDGAVSFGGVWDHRNDPEGIAYGGDWSESDAAKVRAVAAEEAARRPAREKALGYWIQPVPGVASPLYQALNHEPARLAQLRHLMAVVQHCNEVEDEEGICPCGRAIGEALVAAAGVGFTEPGLLAAVEAMVRQMGESHNDSLILFHESRHREIGYEVYAEDEFNIQSGLRPSLREALHQSVLNYHAERGVQPPFIGQAESYVAERFVVSSYGSAGQHEVLAFRIDGDGSTTFPTALCPRELEVKAGDRVRVTFELLEPAATPEEAPADG